MSDVPYEQVPENGEFEENFVEMVPHIFSPSGVDIVEVMKKIADYQDKPALIVKGRYLYFTRYVPNFVGCEFVTWAIRRGFVDNETQAIKLGQFMLDEGYIFGISGYKRTVFNPGWVLYRFSVVERPELFEALSYEERQILVKGIPRHSGQKHTWLDIPVSSFTIPLGTSGVALTWITMSREWQGRGLEYVGYTFGLIAAIIWTFCTVMYCLKMVFQWPKFKNEWVHPIGMNLFPTWTMTILNLANACIFFNPLMAEALWWIGSPIQALFALTVCARWVAYPRDIKLMTPQMFIPVVGLSLVPIAGAGLGFKEIGWLFFGVALVFWIVLFALLMHRLFFVGFLPAKMVPAMFLSIAPPSSLALAFYRLQTQQTDFLDGFGKALFGVAFFFILLLVAIRFSQTTIPFSMAWWAYVFPFAAFASLASAWHRSVSFQSTNPIGYPASFVVVLFASGTATLLWVFVFVFTVIYVVRRKLYMPMGIKHVQPLERGNTIYIPMNKQSDIKTL